MYALKTYHHRLVDCIQEHHHIFPPLVWNLPTAQHFHFEQILAANRSHIWSRNYLFPLIGCLDNFVLGISLSSVLGFFKHLGTSHLHVNSDSWKGGSNFLDANGHEQRASCSQKFSVTESAQNEKTGVVLKRNTLAC